MGKLQSTNIILNAFIQSLNRAGDAHSEMEMFREIALLDQWIASQKKIAGTFDITSTVEEGGEKSRKFTLLDRMQNDCKELEKALEVGFKIYLDNYKKVIEPYQHQRDERLHKKGEEFLREDYEPNPYDGTYSEE